MGLGTEFIPTEMRDSRHYREIQSVVVPKARETVEKWVFNNIPAEDQEFQLAEFVNMLGLQHDPVVWASPPKGIKNHITNPDKKKMTLCGSRILVNWTQERVPSKQDCIRCLKMAEQIPNLDPSYRDE